MFCWSHACGEGPDLSELFSLQRGGALAHNGRHGALGRRGQHAREKIAVDLAWRQNGTRISQTIHMYLS